MIDATAARCYQFLRSIQDRITRISRILIDPVSDACDTVRVTVYSIHRRVFPYSFDSFYGILSRYYLLSAGLRTLSLQLHLYQLDILRFSCCASPGRTEALIDIKKRIVCLRRNYARKAQSPRATPPRF